MKQINEWKFQNLYLGKGLLPDGKTVNPAAPKVNTQVSEEKPDSETIPASAIVSPKCFPSDMPAR
jgi:hypothetical protein